MSVQSQNNNKRVGRVYTPDFIVNNILNLSGYHGCRILKKHVIDNSCGDGAFLIAIVKRYSQEFLKTNDNIKDLSVELSTYIHGIEIDKAEYEKCLFNLDSAVQQFGIDHIQWDIRNADALQVNDFNGKMDFVLGNPPYVRVHNLGESFEQIKSYSFAKNGMTDLYLVFYEIGIKMLSEIGVLGYITPSSFFNSVAGQYLRNYLVDKNLLDKVVDLKHYQAFNATTYTTIVVLKSNRQSTRTEYFGFDEKNSFPYYVDTLDSPDYYINGNFYFANAEQLAELKKILLFSSNRNRFTVKNGFATLADDFFIGEFDFNEYTIPIVKASTGKRYKCFFPYIEGKLVPYCELVTNSSIKKYLEQNQGRLKKRSLEKSDEWYGFGRSQGINDVGKRKYSVNSLVKAVSDIKLELCEEGTGVYSGLYILTEVCESELRDILINDEFIKYISLLGKYKSGGYYTFSSKDLKNYLEYKYSQRRQFDNEQQSIFSYT